MTVAWSPAPYQRAAVAHIGGRIASGVFCDPGGGKTSVTLEALRQAHGRALVIAPRLVCSDVWPREAAKWTQFASWKTLVAQGPKRGVMLDAELSAPAHALTCINPELVPWFVDMYAKRLQKKNPWGWLIIDESSKFKTPSAVRVKALRKIFRLFPRRVILTGTPTPHGLMDLWSQVYLLDGGARLGASITEYRRRYYTEVQCGGGRWREYRLQPGAEARIYAAVADLIVRIDREAFPDMPELRINDVIVTLPPMARKVYDSMQRAMFAEIGDAEIIAESAMAKYQTCRQIANGATQTARVHDAKIERLRDLIGELQGKPAIISYYYRSDLAVLREALGDVPHIGAGVTTAEASDVMRRWNCGEIDMLLCHPGSMAHGLNLQGGGNDIIMFSLIDSLEPYQQLIARLYRRGVVGQVRVHRLIATATVDEAVVRVLDVRDGEQRALLASLREYRGNLSAHAGGRI